MAQQIEDFFEDRARKGDGSFAVAFAIMQLARAQKGVAYQLQCLGLGDAASPMGAIELLSKSISDTGDSISRAISDIADQG